jgi:3-hydroxy-9,10-secoandrosta-1,3,5(10)-triene-9,17-dione monooxygenase reductase component
VIGLATVHDLSPGEKLEREAAAALDAHAFRRALGAFATGVTIVTTCHEGGDVGLTANSFNSVSLNPPMVLWSLGKTSRSLAIFAGASHFAVHILSLDQEALSARFATRGADKFGGLDCARGHGDVPLLEGCAARFQCRKIFEYEGGDHIIFVGEVLAFDHAEKPPLLFHGGKYAAAAPRVGDPGAKQSERSEESLGHLITRAYFALRAPALRHAEERGITWNERHLLGALLDEDGRSIEQINELIGYTGLVATADCVERLAAAGLITTNAAGALWLTPAGREYCLSTIAATKASEAEAQLQMGPRAEVLKGLLSELLESGVAKQDIRLARHMEMIGRNIDGV